ncbi:MAG: hypothetical protein ACFFAS_01470 [Promethearchaeota archaeon]
MGTKRNKIQQLVLFKQKQDIVREVEDKPTAIFESVEREDNIKIVYELKPVGSYYRYSLMIINSSDAPITDIKLNVTFPEFLKIFRCSPINLVPDNSREEENACKVFIDQLNSNSHEQANLYFIPKALNNKGTIRTFVTFVNRDDFVRVLNSEPLEISIPSITIEPQIIPSSKINEIYKDSSFKKALVSLGISIEEQIDYNIILNHMEMILKFNQFQLITRDVKNKVIWFFGRIWNKDKVETSEKFEILVICQIVSGKIEFLISCKDAYHLIGVSTILINGMIERLMRSELIESRFQVFRLDCKNCGVALPSFPKKGEEITCKACNAQQIVW